MQYNQIVIGYLGMIHIARLIHLMQTMGNNVVKVHALAVIEQALRGGWVGMAEPNYTILKSKSQRLLSTAANLQLSALNISSTLSTFNPVSMFNHE
jgi:hypothetical protein